MLAPARLHCNQKTSKYITHFCTHRPPTPRPPPARYESSSIAYPSGLLLPSRTVVGRRWPRRWRALSAPSAATAGEPTDGTRLAAGAPIPDGTRLAAGAPTPDCDHAIGAGVIGVGAMLGIVDMGVAGARPSRFARTDGFMYPHLGQTYSAQRASALRGMQRAA
jgi:hypothetical protein